MSDEKTKSFTIKDLPKDSRPRERLQKDGVTSLSDVELIALILGRGIKGESVMVTAQNLLKEFGSLSEMLDASIEELKEIRGIGFAKATQLLAVMGIARKVSEERIKKEKTRIGRNAIYSPEDIANQVRPIIKDFMKENFVIVSLDVRNKVIETDLVSEGTLSSSLVHPRETFMYAIKRRAAQVVVLHNHPSGDKNPSDDDIKISRRLIDAGKIMGIELIDHIILTQSDYYSFKENGLI